MRWHSESAAVHVDRKRGDILASSIPKVVHLEVKGERVVDWAEELFAVCWYEIIIIKFVEFVEKSRRW